MLLAQGHIEQKRAAASALREKLAQDPALGKDSAVQNQPLHPVTTDDPSTAADALALGHGAARAALRH